LLLFVCNVSTHKHREDAEQLRTELGKREGLLQELLQSQARYSSEVEQLRAALRDAGADADSGDDLDNTANDDGDSDNDSVTPAVRFNVFSAAISFPS
jgi:phage-related minor tail protein